MKAHHRPWTDQDKQEMKELASQWRKGLIDMDEYHRALLPYYAQES